MHYPDFTVVRRTHWDAKELSASIGRINLGRIADVSDIALLITLSDVEYLVFPSRRRLACNYTVGARVDRATAMNPNPLQSDTAGDLYHNLRADADLGVHEHYQLRSRVMHRNSPAHAAKSPTVRDVATTQSSY